MAQLLPSRRSRHACSFCCYGTFRLSQHRPCLTLGPRLRCVAWPVKSFNKLLRQPCLYSFAIGNMHRECAIACACYACLAAVMYRQLACMQHSSSLHQGSNQTTHVWLSFGFGRAGKSTNNNCKSALQYDRHVHSPCAPKHNVT